MRFIQKVSIFSIFHQDSYLPFKCSSSWLCIKKGLLSQPLQRGQKQTHLCYILTNTFTARFHGYLFRPDSIDLLFLVSSCTMIIKKSWKKPGNQNNISKIDNLSTNCVFLYSFMPVFPFIFIIIPLVPLKWVWEVPEKH